MAHKSYHESQSVMPWPIMYACYECSESIELPLNFRGCPYRFLHFLALLHPRKSLIVQGLRGTLQFEDRDDHRIACASSNKLGFICRSQLHFSVLFQRAGKIVVRRLQKSFPGHN